MQHRIGDPLHSAPRQRYGVRGSAGRDHVRDRARDLPRTLGILAPATVRMLPTVSPQPTDQQRNFSHPRISHTLIQPQMRGR